MSKCSSEFLEYIKKRIEEGVEPQSALRDILTDCMHFAIEEELEFEDIVSDAVNVFEVELEDIENTGTFPIPSLPKKFEN